MLSAKTSLNTCKIATSKLLFAVKSDRINALRKQYDAFLEEDKKRKERNDYILGRLDKMRFGTPAVQLRNKPIHTDIGLPVVYNCNQYQPNTCMRQLPYLDRQLLPLDSTRIPVDDTLLIKEMSKKYILIPKFRSTVTKDYIDAVPTQILQSDLQPKHNVNDNDDWKSKYDILEQLKKNEKEENTKASSGIDENLFRSNDDKEPVFNNDQNKVTENNRLEKRGDNTGESSTKYKHELSEKDLTDTKLLENDELPKSEKHRINEIQDIYRSAIAHNNHQSNQQGGLTEHPAAANNSEYKCQNINIEYKSPLVDENNTKIEENVTWHSETDSNLNTDYTIKGNPEIVNSNIQSPGQFDSTGYEENEDANEDKDQGIEKVVYVDDDGICPVQVINPTELIEEINSTAPFEGNSKDTEHVEYPIDIINTQEFTPNEEVKLEEGVNINPEGSVINEDYIDSVYQHNPQSVTVAEAEHTEDPADNSGIEAFDAEQREMFYSEPVNKDYAYNQEGAVDAYNPEYGQDETYQQNEEYVYYEGTQAEQYPVEINEHEESSQPYDQHYEQQYGNTYEQQEFQQDYEQQPTSPQGIQQIEQPVSYDQIQQEFDQQYAELNQEQVESREHVEQELDNEQGYVEKHNMENIEAEKPAILQKQQPEQVEQKA